MATPVSMLAFWQKEMMKMSEIDALLEIADAIRELAFVVAASAIISAFLRRD